MILIVNKYLVNGSEGYHLAGQGIQLPNMVISSPMEGVGALDCYEDFILLAARVYGLVLLVRNWKIIGRRQRDE